MCIDKVITVSKDRELTGWKIVRVYKDGRIKSRFADFILKDGITGGRYARSSETILGCIYGSKNKGFICAYLERKEALFNAVGSKIKYEYDVKIAKVVLSGRTIHAIEGFYSKEEIVGGTILKHISRPNTVGLTKNDSYVMMK